MSLRGLGRRTVAELAVLLAATKELWPVVRSLIRRGAADARTPPGGGQREAGRRRLASAGTTVHVYVKSLSAAGRQHAAELCRRSASSSSEQCLNRHRDLRLMGAWRGGLFLQIEPTISRSAPHSA